MKAYYNDFDKRVCAWLRQLIKDGLITDGDVDDRSIADVRADDLLGYDRIHMFAGVAGWDHALNLAGWGDRPVWTGSCPCQDFSNSGRKEGFDGKRDLWPEMHRLIRECKPATVFGEQVDDSPEWCDRMLNDLEGEGYACASAIIPASAVNAPHERKRFWFVAHSNQERGQGLEPWKDSVISGPWGWRGEEDLQAIAVAPLVRGDRWPQPIIRGMDDGVSGRVDGIAGFGNAICPQLAATFIASYMDCIGGQP